MSSYSTTIGDPPYSLALTAPAVHVPIQRIQRFVNCIINNPPNNSVYIYIDTTLQDGPESNFNLSLSKNTCIKHCLNQPLSGPRRIAITDIDYLIHGCVLDKCVELIEDNGSHLHIERRDINEFNGQYLWKKWMELKPHPCCRGSFNCLTSNDFERMGGFYERLYGWGGEDDVLHSQCRKFGLTIHSIKNLPLIHINHTENKFKTINRSRINTLKHKKGGPQPNFLSYKRQYITSDEDRNDLGGNVLNDNDWYSAELFYYLINTFNIKTALDVGCGTGECVNFLRSQGIEATGIDGLQKNVIGEKFCEQHDLTIYSYKKDVDLIWCHEVVEHIEEKYLDNLLLTLKNGIVIAMTHGLPGQPVYHHVNLQDDKYWIDKISGMGYDLINPDIYRELGGKWWKKSGLVFIKKPTDCY